MNPPSHGGASNGIETTTVSALSVAQAQHRWPGTAWLASCERWRTSLSLLALGIIVAGLTRPGLSAPPTNGPPERWLTNGVSYPAGGLPPTIQNHRFERLGAEFLADTFMIRWFPPASDNATNVGLRVSIDEPGHWPARDWRTYPMEHRGSYWEALVPVDTLEVPLVYFVQAHFEEASGSRGPGVSSMRLCWPRLLGLEVPTRLFWPFVEGFEEGMESWRWMAGSPPGQSFQTSGVVRNGKAALAVTIQPRRTSTTLGTTRLRGWRVMEHGVTGVSLWLRASSQRGQVRAALLSNAFTDQQVVAARIEAIPIETEWRRVELLFSSFGKISLSDLDFMTLEFIGPPGAEFLLDDIQLIGPWVLN
jgi:hypothetical protein